MKRKIIVTINADEKTCGKCDWIWYGQCELHGKELPKGEVDTRCAACLAAERKAKDGGR